MLVNWYLPATRHDDFDRLDASLWIRCLQLLPEFARLGVRRTVNAPQAPAGIDVFLRWQDDDALRFAYHRKALGSRVVYDVCVDYFDESGLFRGGYGAGSEQVCQARAMAGVADMITCASTFIRDRAASVHPHAVCLPDSIDPSHFNRVKSMESGGPWRPRAVWAGVSAKFADVWALLPVLAGQRIALSVISEKDPLPRGSARWWLAKVLLAYRFIPWHYATFPESILCGDVCVSPRDVSTPYNRGHSAFKIAVFLAEGVPAVASPVPSYRELLTDGRAGRICEDGRDWRDALRTVRQNQSRVRDWGVAAPRTVQHLALPAIVKRYVEVFTCVDAMSRG